ncbi:MAG TPA: YegS/Rv2252/BmrU family lipid kinase [Pyrinomonadaceae bacterium]|jgi:YegS/Rv2252/BmrU family lipid kinase|nr:YegS/Rv2252/BmrU family lipid kinase [Pyrinomonadaceae bacterium]
MRMTERTAAAVLISNPNAGRGGSAREREVVRFCELLRARGVEVEVLNTSGSGDAARLAERAAAQGNVRVVIVSGGDGTINEALQGLVGTEVRMGIWPRGTANVLARELGVPFDAERAAEAIARGFARRVHIGCATVEASGERRYFLLMAGVGLDASIVEGVRPRLKRRVGEAAFWYSGVGHLLRWQPRAFQVEIDGETYPATFAAIGNAPHYGGDLSITPRARLDQPEFEICIINSRSRLRYLRLLSRALRGGVPLRTPGVLFIRSTRARATGDVLVQIDGEVVGRLPMTFEVAPHSIEVITPEQG